MTNQTPLAFLILFGIVVLAGCSEGEPDLLDVFPVSGTVRLDGEPVGGVSVSFAPDGETAGRGGYAVSDDAGKFSMRSDGDRDGVPQGSYKVLCSKTAMPDGSPVPEDKMAADVGAENILPMLYDNPGSTPLKAEVTAGENAPFEFDLKSTE